jgi:hypothetical protein
MKSQMIRSVCGRNGWRYFSSMIKIAPVMKSSRFPLWKYATSVDASGRCGEMADAQDLKFSKSHFLTASCDFFSHVFQPLFTSLFSILA